MVEAAPQHLDLEHRLTDQLTSTAPVAAGRQFADTVTPEPSWTTDNSLSDSTLSPEPDSRRESFGTAPALPESTKLLLQQAREGRSVRFAGIHDLQNRSPDRLDTRLSGRSIRAWQGARCPSPTLPQPATGQAQGPGSAPAHPRALAELHHHTPPPGLPVSIPENTSADVPAMLRIKSAASLAGLPPIRKTYPSMELRPDVQARPASAPAAAVMAPAARPGTGSPRGSAGSPDSTMSGSSRSSGSWTRPLSATSVLASPFSDAPPLPDTSTQVDPWAAGSPAHSAHSSPRTSTPEAAKQRGGSAALEALRNPFAGVEQGDEPGGLLNSKQRGSSLALDALKSLEAGEQTSEDSLTKALVRRWSFMREKAGKSLTRQRSAGADKLPPTHGSQVLRSLWRCSADPALASSHSQEE